jgi:multiple sugar transport system substrate-binding protein
MLAGKGSLTLNALSITRTGESEKIPVANKILLARPARGPAAQIGVMHFMSVYVIWNFARNVDGAKRFLVDLAGRSRDVCINSSFYNFPTFTQQVPDLQKLLANDAKAMPADKYAVLADASKWTVPLGYPGYANAAVDEVLKEWIVPRMFADVASGRLTAEASMDMYSGQVNEIFKKWQALKKV